MLIPGGRDVRATIDESDASAGSPDGDACLVACPPHPEHRGHRGDDRLVAVADAMGDRGVDCLRFDYGEWDDGRGELADVHNAIGWARERYDRVGLFGFSFGAALSLLAAGGTRPDGNAGDPPDLAAVSALSPPSTPGAGLDAVAAMDRVTAPGQVVYGARDDTVDWEPVVERARKLGWRVDELSADHFNVGQTETVATSVAAFLGPHLAE